MMRFWDIYNAALRGDKAELLKASDDDLKQTVTWGSVNLTVVELLQNEGKEAARKLVLAAVHHQLRADADKDVPLLNAIRSGTVAYGHINASDRALDIKSFNVEAFKPVHAHEAMMQLTVSNALLMDIVMNRATDVSNPLHEAAGVAILSAMRSRVEALPGLDKLELRNVGPLLDRYFQLKEKLAGHPDAGDDIKRLEELRQELHGTHDSDLVDNDSDKDEVDARDALKAMVRPAATAACALSPVDQILKEALEESKLEGRFGHEQLEYIRDLLQGHAAITGGIKADPTLLIDVFGQTARTVIEALRSLGHLEHFLLDDLIKDLDQRSGLQPNSRSDYLNRLTKPRQLPLQYNDDNNEALTELLANGPEKAAELTEGTVRQIANLVQGFEESTGEEKPELKADPRIIFDNFPHDEAIRLIDRLLERLGTPMLELLDVLVEKGDKDVANRKLADEDYYHDCRKVELKQLQPENVTWEVRVRGRRFDRDGSPLAQHAQYYSTTTTTTSTTTYPSSSSSRMRADQLTFNGGSDYFTRLIEKARQIPVVYCTSASGELRQLLNSSEDGVSFTDAQVRRMGDLIQGYNPNAIGNVSVEDKADPWIIFDVLEKDAALNLVDRLLGRIGVPMLELLDVLCEQGYTVEAQRMVEDEDYYHDMRKVELYYKDPSDVRRRRHPAPGTQTKSSATSFAADALTFNHDSDYPGARLIDKPRRVPLAYAQLQNMELRTVLRISDDVASYSEAKVRKIANYIQGYALGFPGDVDESSKADPHVIFENLDPDRALYLVDRLLGRVGVPMLELLDVVCEAGYTNRAQIMAEEEDFYHDLRKVELGYKTEAEVRSRRNAAPEVRGATLGTDDYDGDFDDDDEDELERTAYGKDKDVPADSPRQDPVISAEQRHELMTAASHVMGTFTGESDDEANDGAANEAHVKAVQAEPDDYFAAFEEAFRALDEQSSSEDEGNVSNVSATVESRAVAGGNVSDSDEDEFAYLRIGGIFDVDDETSAKASDVGWFSSREVSRRSSRSASPELSGAGATVQGDEFDDVDVLDASGDSNLGL